MCRGIFGTLLQVLHTFPPSRQVATVEEFVRHFGGTTVIKRILIANNGIAVCSA